ncbi:S-adenosylmethionine mitochondrial carrier protein homolog isoform X1 [Bicyclus anynana]|uniref:S-adenosylmethionine mitochondrial carrier protein homolog isoform X1 n=1 Tax=Bicyclus anynana TaxID=110368 RepID=A0ABM3M179_BICAN|nr:S-adenosylmethionine mitochondrial carrier protein homolog isoform X1 [Bicyclus anynana]XP_052745111.1 S-adenosylmethionine mitochondrial carrier protein homolog isoform X1 [Bicyclus anynana]
MCSCDCGAAGLLTVATSSMPTTALFFMSYEATKSVFQPLVLPQYAPLVHMFAASVGETLACLIRVPTEIAKQRKQTYTGTEKRSSIRILLHAFRTEGLRKGVYRGYLSTVLRDLPFSFIELPLWEMMKSVVRARNDGDITSFQSALCGSIAGGIAAASTTPLDLAKTRIMLADGYSSTRKLRIRPVLADIYLQSGVRGLFAGVTPRMTAFMIGGFVFFGVYEHSKAIYDRHLAR